MSKILEMDGEVYYIIEKKTIDDAKLTIQLLQEFVNVLDAKPDNVKTENLSSEYIKFYHYIKSVTSFKIEDYCIVSGKTNGNVRKMICTMQKKGLIEPCKDENGYPIRGKYQIKS